MIPLHTRIQERIDAVPINQRPSPMAEQVASCYMNPDNRLSFKEDVKRSLQGLKESISKTETIFRKRDYFKPLSYDAEGGLALVVAKKMQFTRLAAIYPILQSMCIVTDSTTRERMFDNETSTLIKAWTDGVVTINQSLKKDLDLIEAVESARDSSQRKIALDKAIEKGIPIEFLRSVFRKGIYTDTSSLSEHDLIQLNSMLNAFEHKASRSESNKDQPSAKRHKTTTSQIISLEDEGFLPSTTNNKKEAIVDLISIVDLTSDIDLTSDVVAEKPKSKLIDNTRKLNLEEMD